MACVCLHKDLPGVPHNGAEYPPLVLLMQSCNTIRYQIQREGTASSRCKYLYQDVALRLPI